MSMDMKLKVKNVDIGVAASASEPVVNLLMTEHITEGYHVTVFAPLDRAAVKALHKMLFEAEREAWP